MPEIIKNKHEHFTVHFEPSVKITTHQSLYNWLVGGQVRLLRLSGESLSTPFIRTLSIHRSVNSFRRVHIIKKIKPK